MKQDFLTTSLATVYKMVVLQENEGEILELGFTNRSKRYDGNKPYPHPHPIYLECQDIVDLAVATLQNLPVELAQKVGYQVVSHRLDLFGVCSRCLLRFSKRLIVYFPCSALAFLAKARICSR